MASDMFNVSQAAAVVRTDLQKPPLQAQLVLLGLLRPRTVIPPQHVSMEVVKLLVFATVVRPALAIRLVQQCSRVLCQR